MMWLLVLLIVVVLGFTYLMGTGWFGEMPTPPLDEPTSDVLTDDGPLTADDLRRVSFPVMTRGYSMRQVDALLARLADQLGPGDGLPATLAPLTDGEDVADAESADDPADLAEVADLVPVTPPETEDDAEPVAESGPLTRNESAVSSLAE